MAKPLVLVTLLVVAGYAAQASATAYNVGDSQGWTTGADYTRWASNKAFAVGDTLAFSYPAKAHSVTEVSKSDYDACSGRNAMRDDDNGNTVVTLDSPGWHYYICNVPGHCAAGMKLAVMVSATPNGATPSGGGALVPAMGSVVAAAVGAAIKLALL
ncbi:hypothetical protein PR202_gb22350 [Eleusine coracana subsp. coracana]|uniref:Phytocyanin domain-containing protein n=1 Tax=Eleusine coracana subsp. coracana TaxID=191504 RepID=A0AAV5FGD1_ELECO|nr:hypothetical protein QOZ80_6AG0538340 [Eleusine coracana subsp. coracana]GJN33727.1 hypothetical protein PR202_gb22350 [Eleusine coracana subsp. coracana]